MSALTRSFSLPSSPSSSSTTPLPSSSSPPSPPSPSSSFSSSSSWLWWLRVRWPWVLLCALLLCCLLWLLPRALSLLLEPLKTLQPDGITAFILFGVIVMMCSPLTLGYGAVIVFSGVLFGWWGFPLAYSARSVSGTEPQSQPQPQPHASITRTSVSSPLCCCCCCCCCVLVAVWWVAVRGSSCSARPARGVAVWAVVAAADQAWAAVWPLPPPRCTCAR